MSPSDWIQSLPVSVIVCDREGMITGMNSAAEALFADRGGRALIGTSLFDCHPPPAQEKLRTLMRERKSNAYTAEKAGKNRMVYQSPWYRDGEFAGLVEISFEVPRSIPHFVRA